MIDTSQTNGVVFGDFKSCRLIWDEGTSIRQTTTLLPIKYAKIGRKIELEENNKWVSWFVSAVSDNVIHDPTDPKVLIKYHRSGTGDSLPKRKNK